MNCKTVHHWLDAAEFHKKLHDDDYLVHVIRYDNPPQSDHLVFFCTCGQKFALDIADMMASVLSVPMALRGQLFTDTGRHLLADMLNNPGLVWVDYEKEL